MNSFYKLWREGVCVISQLSRRLCRENFKFKSFTLLRNPIQSSCERDLIKIFGRIIRVP